MEVSILSIKEFKYYKKYNEKDVAVIMSTSTDEQLKQVKNKLVLYYDDNYKDFNSKMAGNVLRFAAKNKSKKIYCLCDAGISRSSGIAAALCKIYNGNDSHIWNDWHYEPNKYIYNTILQTIKEG